MPQTFRFCSICKINHNLGRKHIFTNKHREKLREKLEKAKNRVNDVKFFIENVRKLQKGEESCNKFWCFFCHTEIREHGSQFVCESAIRHLASTEHLEKLKSHGTENGTENEKRSVFTVSPIELEQWEDRCRTILTSDSSAATSSLPAGNIEPLSEKHLAISNPPTKNNNNNNNIPPPSSSPTFLSSSVAPLHASVLRFSVDLPLPPVPQYGTTQIVQNTASWQKDRREGQGGEGGGGGGGEGRGGGRGGQEGELVKGKDSGIGGTAGDTQEVEVESRTVISRNGILQNPFGHHVGQRVWGGGIVKYKKGEWKLWPIDLDDESPEFDSANQTTLGAIPNRREEKNGRDVTPTPIPMQQPRENYVEGFTCISPPPLLPGEKNIHSGAFPPWFQQNEAFFCVDSSNSNLNSDNVHSSSSSSSIFNSYVDPSSKKKKHRNPKRVGALWAERRLSEILRETEKQTENKEMKRGRERGEEGGEDEGAGRDGTGDGESDGEGGEGGSDVWLPSFGRVWQSGSRKDSRKEFEGERKKLERESEKMVPRIMKVKPYVSKRQKNGST